MQGSSVYGIIKVMENKSLKDSLQKIFHFPDIFQQLFSKKIDSALVVSIGTNLKLISVGSRGGIKINAFKVVEFKPENKNEEIIKSLQDFVKEHNIPQREVILSLAPKSLLIKRLQMPVVPDEELPQAIRWRLKEDTSLDLSGAIIGHQIIKRTAKDDGTNILDIICASAEEKELKNEVMLLKQGGFNSICVCAAVFGYAKIIERYFKEGKDGSLGILQITDDLCSLALYKEDKLNFYRELPVSINRLKDALKGALSSSTGTVELSPDEIREVLFKFGVPISEFVYKNKISSSQILAMLRPLLERLAQEIKRSIDYYDAQFQGGAASRIMITGEASLIPNLDKFLSKELNLEISVFSLADKVSPPLGIDISTLSQAGGALGLALDYGNNINLLPLEFRTQKFENVQRFSLRWIAFFAFLALIVSFIFAKTGVVMQQKRLDNTLLHLKVLSEVKQIKAKLDALDNFVSQVRGMDVHAGVILNKLSTVAPRELFFNEFSLNCDAKSGSISGFVKSTDTNPDNILSRFVNAMNSSGHIKNAAIYSVQKMNQDGAEIATFRITFQLP